MAEGDLPVPIEPDEASSGKGEAEKPAPQPALPAGGRAASAGRLALVLLAGGAGALLAVGGGTVLGEGFRNALLIETDVRPPARPPAYADRPEASLRFFDRRDSVTVRVPRDMSAREFLALYHLENHPAARRALAEQLGARELDAPLREGEPVTFRLTLPREAAP